MNKDALLATIIGFGIGLVITGALILGPSISKSFPKLSLPKITLPKINLASKQGTSPAPALQPTELTVTIAAPLDEAIEPDKSVVVSGTTLSGAIVAVAGELDDDVVKTNGDGGYAGKVSLTEGENVITVTAYKGGKSISQTVTVFYTPEEF